MKKLLMIMMIAIGVSSVAFCQTKKSKNPKVEAQIIALEKAGWGAWKNKNAVWFKNNLTEDFVMVNSKGITNKAQILKTTNDCEVKSFSLDNFKFVMLDENAALLTYTAMQDAVCSGETIPAKVRASVNYVKRGGKWLEAFYMETPITQ
jgi:hypothetical protein